MLGITGPPGGGKSTLARAIAESSATARALVGMDGFHLAQAELVRLGRRDRKGALDTFDAAGYVALLRRLRDADEDVVYAPEFRREIEEPIAGAVAVPRDCRWSSPRATTCWSTRAPGPRSAALLDEAWYVRAGRGDAPAAR